MNEQKCTLQIVILRQIAVVFARRQQLILDLTAQTRCEQ